MSTTKLTWRPATADDVGRLARFDDPYESMVTIGTIQRVVQRGDVLLFVANAHEYPLCEVQDVEAEDLRCQERDRIMGLFDEFVSEILKAASDGRSVEVAWVLQQFVDAVNNGSTSNA